MVVLSPPDFTRPCCPPHAGLRFFEEVGDGRAGSQCFSPVPCMSALGTIEAPPDAVFKLLLDLSTSRNE